FFEKCEGTENYTVPDYAAASCAQHATRDQLQDKFFAVDDDCVPGIVASGVASHDGKIFGEDIDDLAFAFVTSLGADDDRSSSFIPNASGDHPITLFNLARVNVVDLLAAVLLTHPPSRTVVVNGSFIT